MTHPLENGGPPQMQQQIPPAEWMMVGFQCAVQDIDLGGQRMKALIFKRDGVLLVFPVDRAGAYNIGNQLLDKPAIAVPSIEIPKV